MNAAIVQITIAPTSDGQLVVVFKSTKKGRSLKVYLSQDRLDKARNTVASTLRRFKDNVGSSLGPGTEGVKYALRDLFVRTTLLGGSMTGSPDQLENLQELFVEALPDWATHPEVPLVEVEGPSYGFPFELLPVFDLNDDGHVEDIEVFARRFLGFSACVRRLPYEAVSSVGLPVGHVLHGAPLPLSFAWYAPMEGARAERNFFVRLAEHVELNGPWPEPSLTSDAVLKALANGLVDPRLRYTTQMGRDVQIHHFACHCDTNFEDPADYELRLAGDDRANRRITLGELNVKYHNGPKLDKQRERPLVFLNACGSGHLDPRAVYSWPEWFLETRHRAVIGPETLIPDHAAAQYACFFYRALFSQHSIGEALVLARRELLHQFGNPLGLLYVLYGDPTITVDKPMPHELLYG